MARKKKDVRKMLDRVPKELADHRLKTWTDWEAVKALYLLTGLNVPSMLEPYLGVSLLPEEAPPEVRFTCFRDDYCHAYGIPLSAWGEAGISGYCLRRSRF